MTDSSVSTIKKPKIPNIARPRTKIAERELPDYTKGEEIFNTATHVMGAVFGIAVLVLCVIKAALNGNVWGVATGAVYGVSMILVYLISSVYHGLSPKTASLGKKVMQVIDHCDIYFLIVGTYVPLALTGLRAYSPGFAWTVFGIVTGVSIIGMIFTAIDFNKFSVISQACYFIAGWCIVFSFKTVIAAYSLPFAIWILAGGVAYTSGMLFYVLQDKGYRYCHSIFHLFILAGSILQFIGIYQYCM